MSAEVAVVLQGNETFAWRHCHPHHRCLDAPDSKPSLILDRERLPFVSSDERLHGLRGPCLQIAHPFAVARPADDRRSDVRLLLEMCGKVRCRVLGLANQHNAWSTSEPSAFGPEATHPFRDDVLWRIV